MGSIENGGIARGIKNWVTFADLIQLFIVLIAGFWAFANLKTDVSTLRVTQEVAEKRLMELESVSKSRVLERREDTRALADLSGEVRVLNAKMELLLQHVGAIKKGMP